VHKKYTDKIIIIHMILFLTYNDQFRKYSNNWQTYSI